MKTSRFKTLFCLGVCSFLQACGSGGDSENSFRALVDGPVSSALFERLVNQHFSVTTYDGTQDVREYDVVVGDVNVPQAATLLLAEGKPLREALHRHVPVVLFNLFDSEIERELSKLTRLRVGGRNLAYVINSGCDQRGDPSYQISPMQEIDVSVAQDVTTPRDGSEVFVPGKIPTLYKHGQDAAVLEQLLSKYSERIVEELANDSRGECDATRFSSVAWRDSTSTDIAPPAQIPYFHTEIHWDFPVTVGGAGGFGTATESTHIDFTVDVYYDSSTTPHEYKAFIFQDGQVYVDSSQELQGKKYNLELIQTSFWSSYALSGTTGIFSTLFAPTNVNQSETVTDEVSQSIGATVGYQTASVTGSYSTSRSVSHEISQWNIENTSKNAQSREWHYSQAIFSAGYDSQPAISRNNLSYQNVALWILPAGTTSITLTASPARRFSNFVVRKNRSSPQIFSDIIYPTPQHTEIDFPPVN